LHIQPVKGVDGAVKAREYQTQIEYFEVFEAKNEQTQIVNTSDWISLEEDLTKVLINNIEGADNEMIKAKNMSLYVQLRSHNGEGIVYSSKKQVLFTPASNDGDTGSIWPFLVMLTAMVGFWATMSISIADITRYSKTQKEQVAGQFIGLPGTMILYSFVGIFVTCASVAAFDDVLIRADAPWDPAALLAKFKEPAVVIISQIFLIIATLSTNIAANVIAPANAFANAMPRKISFRTGGIITAVIGILICPWWIINHIVPFLLFVSSLLGPVVAILICDYFIIRKTELKVVELFKTNGEYSFGGSGFNKRAMIAFLAGVFAAGIGKFVPSLSFLYDLSWFSGFIVSFFLYWVMMRGKTQQ
jgi:NCS1 family nucleobase:cation symporter-1